MLSSKPGLTVGTLNLQATPARPQADVVHDVRRAAAVLGVIGWTEVRHERYRAAVRALGPRWATYWAPGRPNFGEPISWDTRVWEFVRAEVRQLHPRTSGICQERTMVAVLLRRRGSRRLVWFVNAHYVPPGRSLAVWQRRKRERMWAEGNARHRAFLTWLARDGHPIFGLGDYNKRGQVVGAVIAGRKVTYLSVPDVDHVFFIAGRRLTLQLHRSYALPGFRTDHHDAHVVTGSLRRR